MKIKFLEISENEKYLVIPKGITKEEMQEEMRKVSAKFRTAEPNIDWLISSVDGDEWVSFEVEYCREELFEIEKNAVLSFVWDKETEENKKDDCYILNYLDIAEDKKIRDLALNILRNL